jgi:alpha-aminoadipate/glutamate carrier protein LysW
MRNSQFSIHYFKEEHTMTANCPECDATITLAADVVEGEIIVCPDCAAELELTSVDPVELALAPEVGEDWGE